LPTLLFYGRFYPAQRQTRTFYLALACWINIVLSITDEFGFDLATMLIDLALLVFLKRKYSFSLDGKFAI
jgi:hypothetical protein